MVNKMLRFAQHDALAVCSGAVIWLAAVVMASATGCRPAEQSPTTSAASTSASGPAEEREVVVYTALDEDFSRPILEDFTKQTGIQVRAAYDTESTKTVGLTNRIRAEANRPRCDVFWNNEILNTLLLQHEGLLQPCRPTPTNAADYPERYRDPESYWFGFAGRARVLIVNTQLVKPDEIPTSVRDLGEARWKGRAGIAKPLFGTTASHVACLFAVLGEDPAKELLHAWKANDVRVLGGNKACAETVGAGNLALALTDTDDAVTEVDAGRPVRLVFPDGGTGQMGTLLLPNTLALVKGCPHPEAGRQLINYLLSAEVEGELARGPSAQIPLGRKAKERSRVADLKDLRPMEVDYHKAAEEFPAAAKYIEGVFLAP